MRWLQQLPMKEWLGEYNRDTLASDLLAGLIVTIMLIPQSLAYALLAGVPAEIGLYASMLPLIIYALLGSSRTLSVGPVAVISLMTASSISAVTRDTGAEYLSAAVTLAMLSGSFLMLLGFLRLGFMANFLSHPIVSGFITASGVIIALSQFKHLLGIRADGDSVIELGQTLLKHLGDTNPYTLGVGVSVLVFLFWARSGAARLLTGFGVSAKVASLSAKAAPAIGVIATILISYLLGLEQKHVALVGDIPSGLPGLSLPAIDADLLESLLVPAMLISIIGYVESVSVGKTLAARRKQRIKPNQELIALGAANIGSAFSGAFPVTGGFSRSVVNFDAGAVTPAAGIYAAMGIALASQFLTPMLYFLPKATLAATIIVAVIALIDLSVFRLAWRYARSDFYSVLVTVAVTLLYGVEIGVSCGVLTSLGLFLYRASRPHIAIVGLVEGTEHFRNVNRFKVKTCPHILSLRVDQSLFFANAGNLEDEIYEEIYQQGQIEHVILMCSAVNEIDLSALEVLEDINQRLQEQGIQLHLSEVKGPVMDALQKSDFTAHLSGSIYLTQYAAFTELGRRYENVETNTR